MADKINWRARGRKKKSDFNPDREYCSEAVREYKESGGLVTHLPPSGEGHSKHESFMRGSHG